MNENAAFALSALTVSDVEKLIAEDKLLRILHPALKAQVKRALEQGKALPCVVQNEGHLYISLLEVEDDKKRHYFYRLIQQCQAGERVNIKELPLAIQQVLEPELTLTGRVFGAILLGAVAGVVAGVLAMALTILVVNGVRWLGNGNVGQFAGMELTAVSFIIFTFVGWAGAGFLAWCRPHLWSSLSTPTNILRRK